MADIKLLPCPFCGGKAFMCGREERDYDEGEWSKYNRRVYWIICAHEITCIFGSTHSRAFGTVEGIQFTSEEFAAKAWNTRKGCDIQCSHSVQE